MMLFTLRITSFPTRRHDVLRALRTLAGVTGSRRGCLFADVLVDIDNPNEITWTEEWESEKDLSRHIASDEYRKLLAVMDMSMSRPEIRFHTVTQTAGMEFIAAKRESPG